MSPIEWAKHCLEVQGPVSALRVASRHRHFSFFANAFAWLKNRVKAEDYEQFQRGDHRLDDAPSN